MQDKQIKIQNLLNLLKTNKYPETEDIAQELSELGYIFPEPGITNDKPF